MEPYIVTGLIGILGVLVGGLLTGLITYYFQKRVQDRSWKRDHGLKLNDLIYKPLSKEILDLKGAFINYGSIVSDVEWSEKENDFIYSEGWDKIKSGHLDLMILDKKFKERIDDFFEKKVAYTYTYVKAINRVNDFAIEILGTGALNLDFSNWELMYGAMFQGQNFDDYLIKRFNDVGLNLKDRIFKRWEDGNLSFPEDFFDQLLTRSNEDPVINKLRGERKELIQECDYFLEELARRIEAPWKM